MATIEHPTQSCASSCVKRTTIPQSPNTKNQGVIFVSSLLLRFAGPTEPATLSHLHPVFIPTSLVYSKNFQWEGLTFLGAFWKS